MKIYAEKDKETDSVEILLSYQELKILTSALSEFEDKVRQFKIKNKDKENLGFTHIHSKDCGLKDSDTDIVVYVNLDED